MRKEGISNDLPEILVTGGMGFIGSEFVRQAVREGYKIIVVDKITYAGDVERLREVKGKYKFYQADICNAKKINSIFKKDGPKEVVHFAAETHVDRSIKDPSVFLKTNLLGTKNLLEASRRYHINKFIHISTDEVYGDIDKGKFREGSPLKPSSPYAASKACADLLIRSYARTYGLPAIIVRPCNNYGPWQYPEKLIPVIINSVIQNKKVPVYADGLNVREWLFVSDCAKGILSILKKGKVQEVYNLGSQQERKNIEVVRAILKALKRGEEMIEFVKDRPGHDIRYSLDSSRLFNKTGWRPRINFEEGIKYTLQWYLGHKEWLLSKVQRSQK